MKTIETQLFKFSELSDAAKARAVEKYRDATIQNGDSFWHECDEDGEVTMSDSECDDMIREHIQDNGTLIEFDGGIIVSSF